MLNKSTLEKRVSILENLFHVIVLVMIIAPFLFCFFIVYDIHILINNYIGINNFFIESDSQSNSILFFVILLVFCFLLLFILDDMLNYNKMRLFLTSFNEGKEFFLIKGDFKLNIAKKDGWFIDDSKFKKGELSVNPLKCRLKEK